MNGKLIVIDGIDSVGKQTQKEMLRDYLIKRGCVEDKDFAVVDFPRYNEFSSEFVRAYLGGKLTSNPNDIDPYLASTFYSIDRALSFKNEKWGEVYRNDGMIIADRYTCSNVIYQGSKLMEIKHPITNNPTRIDDQVTLHNFARWLFRFELSDLKLPKPDAIVYLMLDEKANQKLLDKRAETEGKDIHEANNEFLNRCRYTLGIYKEIMENNFAYQMSSLGFMLGNCNNVFLNITDPKTGEIMDRESIHNKIRNSIFDYNPYVTVPRIPWLITKKDKDFKWGN